MHFKKTEKKTKTKQNIASCLVLTTWKNKHTCCSQISWLFKRVQYGIDVLFFFLSCTQPKMFPWAQLLLWVLLSFPLSWSWTTSMLKHSSLFNVATLEVLCFWILWLFSPCWLCFKDTAYMSGWNAQQSLLK